MLGSLTGVSKGRLKNRLLLEVNKVGYWVHTGSWQPEGEVSCYLYQHIREDSQELYGFIDLPTLSLFEELISISGIGPKVGLAILSIGSTEDIKEAIVQADTDFLSSAPGVGQKAAQKIIFELGKKMDDLSDSSQNLSQRATQQDILEALESLGYKPSDLRPLLKKIPTDLVALDTQIKWVLQQLVQ